MYFSYTYKYRLRKCELSGDWAELGNIVKCESTDNNKYDDADSTTVPMVNYLLFCYCVNEFQALSCPTQ